MTTCKLIKQELPNIWDYMARDERSWVIYIGDRFQDLFDKYPTKKEAIADAKKYGFKIV